MNNSKHLIILISIFTFLTSCQKADGLIDNKEERLMEECSEQPFSSKSALEENLIGEWKLVGYGNSVFEDEPQPDINLTISDTEIIFKFSDEDEELEDVISWEVDEINSPSGQFFRLNTTPARSELTLYQFCEKYMYGETSSINSTVARMYLYKKVR